MIDKLIYANAAALVVAVLVGVLMLQPGAMDGSAGAADVRLAVRPAPCPEVDVRLDDVDRSDPAGAQALLLRIRSAAEAVCGSAAGSKSRRGDQDCVRETIDRAVAALGSPQVAAANASGDELAASGPGH